MSKILAGYDVAALGYGTPDAIHLLAECCNIAAADRAAYLGDPAQVRAPLAWLLSTDYAAERRGQINMQQRGTPRHAAKHRILQYHPHHRGRW